MEARMCFEFKTQLCRLSQIPSKLCCYGLYSWRCRIEEAYLFFILINMKYIVDLTHNLCCQIRADDNSSTCTFTTGKSVTATGACANEIIPKSINRSFVYKAKEGRYVRMWYQWKYTTVFVLLDISESK
jgi:hypothetical protein